MADLYASYTALAAAETEGVSYSRTAVTVSGATWASIAIHGGGIERGSGEMARQVAGDYMSFYEFAGLKSSGNQDLHVTSTNFDEPMAVSLVAASSRTLSFHGFTGTAGVAETAVGGLDSELVDRVTAALTGAGFAVVSAPSEIAGTDPTNICNENARSAGVQLEMSKALRDSFFPGGASAAAAAAGLRTGAFYRYAAAVQSAYLGYGRMSMGSVNNSRWALQPAPGADVTLSASVSTDKLAAGGGQFLALVARYADASNCYLARLEYSTTQTVILTLRKRVAGTESLLVQFTTALTHTVGGRVAWELRVSGSTLKARAWAAGTAKPDWQLTTTDTSLTAAGQVGLRSILSSTNTNTLPVIASYDDFVVAAPAGGPGGMSFDVTSPTGDVEAPLFLQVAASDVTAASPGPSGGRRQSLIAVRRGGTPAAAPVVLQAESMTVDPDTSVQAASGSSGTFLRTTFAARLDSVVRASIDPWPASPSVDARGTYRVFLRCRKTVSTDVVQLQMLYSSSSTSVYSDVVTCPADTLWRWVDMGLVQIPLGFDPGADGLSGVPVAVNGLAAWLYVGRPTGTGSFDFDVAMFVPADDRLAMVKWPESASSSETAYVVDPVAGQAYGVGSSGQVRSALTESVGGLPMVSPGVVNRVWFMRDVGLTHYLGDEITASVQVTPYYWPRYLYVRPVAS